MGLCIHRFIVRGFIPLLLFNVVQLSTIKRDVISLKKEVQVEANHLRSLGRIVNGSAASFAQFPHQVSLRYTLSRNHFCGGNIIGAEWILTAAHCMFQPSTGAQLQPWQITAVAGDLWLNRTSATSQQREVFRIIIHENYNTTTLENDIALLRLTLALTLGSPAVQTGQLQTTRLPVGTVCQVAGWGYAASDTPPAVNELMYINVPMVSRELCRELYAEFSDIPEGMICAGYVEGLRDACQGDSGGGLICHGILTGIVSWGEGCAQPNYPGVYTEVNYYRNWISQRIGNDLRDDLEGRNGADGVKLSLWTWLVSFSVIGLVTRTFKT